MTSHLSRDLDRLHIPRPTAADRLAATRWLVDHDRSDVLAALGLDHEAHALALARLSAAVTGRDVRGGRVANGAMIN